MDNYTDIKAWEKENVAEVENAAGNSKLRVAELPRHRCIAVAEIILDIGDMGPECVFIMYDRERRADGKADLDFVYKYIKNNYPAAAWVQHGLEKPWPNPGNLERLSCYESALRSMPVLGMDIFDEHSIQQNVAGIRQLIEKAHVNWNPLLDCLRMKAMDFELVDDQKLVYYHGEPVETAMAEITRKRDEAAKRSSACELLNSELEAAGIGIIFTEPPVCGLYSVYKVVLPDSAAPLYCALCADSEDYASRIESYLSAINAPEPKKIKPLAVEIDPLIPFDMESEGARRLDALLYDIGPKTDIAHARMKEALACAVCKAIDAALGTEGEHVPDLSSSPLQNTRKIAELNTQVRDLEDKLAHPQVVAEDGSGFVNSVAIAVFTENDVADALASAAMHVSPALINVVSTELRAMADAWVASAKSSLTKQAVEIAQRKVASILCAEIACFIDEQAAQMPFVRGIYAKQVNGIDNIDYGFIGGDSPARVAGLAASIEADKGSWKLRSVVGKPETLELCTESGALAVRYVLSAVIEGMESSGIEINAQEVFENSNACITPPMKYALLSEFPQISS